MLITNFAAGQLSPTLNGRVDLAQYFFGALKIKNYDVIPTGGIKRRCGTERIARLHGQTRLIPFILNSDTNFILECCIASESNPLSYVYYDSVAKSEVLITATSGTVIYIWKNGQRVMTDYDIQLGITGPWNSIEELRQVQCAQNYDIMILVQENHRPQELKYNAGTDTWTYGNMSFDFSVDVQLDDDYDVVYVWEGSALPSYNVFTSPTTKEEKAYYYLVNAKNGMLYWWNCEEDHRNGDGNIKVYWEKSTATTEYEMDTELFQKENKYPRAVAFFNQRLYFASTKNDRQKIWASAAPDIEGTRYNQFSTYIKYVTVNKVTKDPDIHFFTADGASGSQTLTNVTQNLAEQIGSDNYDDYYITADSVAVGTKIQDFVWDATESKGTLTITSALTGDADAQVMSAQKWLYRTTASETDYTYKVVNNNMTTEDNAFYFEVASDQNDAVKWLAAGRSLVIGTESSTYVVPSTISATNTVCAMDGRYGSDDLQATVIQSATVFFSQGKKAIREYYYSAAEEAFISQDLAMSCPEVLESAAVDFDFMTNPYSRLIVTRADGKACVLLYEKSAGVQAWTEWNCGYGSINSVAVVRGSSATDIVYVSVYESGSYYLEKLDSEKYIYLDSWSEYKSSVIDNYNTEKSMLYNVTKDEYYLYSDKAEHVIENTDEVYIGYPYESTIKSMPIVDSNATGRKRITKLLVRFYESYRPELEVTGRTNETLTAFIEPFTGVKEIVYPGNSERDVTFTLTISKPKACTILAVNALIAE